MRTLGRGEIASSRIRAFDPADLFFRHSTLPATEANTAQYNRAMARNDWVQRLRAYGTRVFGIDLRALAVFRMALGLTLLAYVISMALDFESLLTERGVLPVDAIWPAGSADAWFYALVDAPAFVALLLGAMAAASILLATGIQTRMANIFLWICVGFLVRRNPWAHNAQHAMTHFCLLWAMFLPLDARWTLGRLRRDVRLQYVSPATVGLILQVLFVYVTSGFAKSGPDWHADADAIYLIAHTEKLQTVFSPLLAALPISILAVLTRSIWYLEVLSPLILISPLYFVSARTGTALLLIGMHVGLGAFVRLGIFPAIAITYLVALLPRQFWDRLFPGSGSEAEADDVGSKIRPARYAAHAIAALLVACMLTSYLESVPGLGGNSPVWMRRLAGELRIGHVYRLFSHVSHSESRYLVLGKFGDGSTFDLISKSPAQISWNAARISIAPDGSDRFPWVNSTARASQARFADTEQPRQYAAYFCRNVQPSSVRLEKVEILHLLRRIAGNKPNQFVSRIAYAYECPDTAS